MLNEKLKSAADGMDWQQVVQNGGPPCFCLMPDGRFCGRAKAWEGHHVYCPTSSHKFVSLAELLESVSD